MLDLKELAGTKMLNALRIEDPRELILVVPESVIDCRHAVPKAGDTGEDSCVIRLRPVGLPRAYTKKGKYLPPDMAFTFGAFRVDFDFIDDAGQEIGYSHFGSGTQAPHFHEMGPIHVSAQIQRYGKKFYLKKLGIVPPAAKGTVWPQYKGIPGQVSGEKISNVMTALRESMETYKATRHFARAKIAGECGIPESEILELVQSPFGSIEALIDALHFPKTPEENKQAVRTARKISGMAIQASALRQNVRQPHPRAPIIVDNDDIAKLIASQPEKLSKDQLKVISQVTARIANPKPMNGLLSGDVGTGKTLAFLIPAIAAHAQGVKVAIMAPTTILADQIAMGILNRFGSFCSVERIQAGGKIQDHNAILVGTSGMQTVMKNAKYVPGLLICDEQHKMATASKEGSVGPWTHTLEVSATPIPRSLASALYGGMDIFDLRECPVDKTINCVVCDKTSRIQAMDQIRYSLANGERAAIIYPRVEVKKKTEGDKPEATDEKSKPKKAAAKGKDEPEVAKAEVMTIKSVAATMEQHFPGQVAVLHGQLEPEEIRATIADVKAGKRNLIIASTVIETGVDIPSISAMIVRDADRFGISQLHQLRGRLVRNGGVGVFIMMVEDIDQLAEKSPTTLERLDAVAATKDGYDLAEKDLMLRGFGELEGDNQAGESVTLFKMVKMSASDFLSAQLKTLDVSRAEMAEPEEERVGSQPRLF